MRNKKKKKEVVKNKVKQIEKVILPIAIDIAKSGEGALFIIGKNIRYSRLLKQKIESFSVFSRGARKLLRSLGVIDGAVIINMQGDVVEYSVLIKGTKPFLGYGTRHAAAMTASRNENIAILCSEEEHKVKIFKNGKYIMQIDALQKNVEKNIPQIASILESVGAGFLGTIGTAVLAPTLGIALLPGVIIFGGSYYAIKTIFNRFHKK